MQNSLNRRDTSRITMENVEGRERPPSEPHENIIPTGEQPHQREVGKADDASPIGEVPPKLVSGVVPAEWIVSALIERAG